jgi:hypothetical protein
MQQEIRAEEGKEGRREQTRDIYAAWRELRPENGSSASKEQARDIYAAWREREESTPEQTAAAAPVAIKSTVQRRFQTFKRRSQAPLELRVNGGARQSSATCGYSYTASSADELASTASTEDLEREERGREERIKALLESYKQAQAQRIQLESSQPRRRINIHNLFDHSSHELRAHSSPPERRRRSPPSPGAPVSPSNDKYVCVLTSEIHTLKKRLIDAERRASIISYPDSVTRSEEWSAGGCSAGGGGGEGAGAVCRTLRFSPDISAVLPGEGSDWGENESLGLRTGWVGRVVGGDRETLDTRWCDGERGREERGRGREEMMAPKFSSSELLRRCVVAGASGGRGGGGGSGGCGSQADEGKGERGPGGVGERGEVGERRGEGQGLGMCFGGGGGGKAKRSEETRPLHQLALTSVVQYYLEDRTRVSAGGNREREREPGSGGGRSGIGDFKAASDVCGRGGGARQNAGEEQVPGYYVETDTDNTTERDREQITESVSAARGQMVSARMAKEAIKSANTSAEHGQREKGRGGNVTWGGVWWTAITLVFAGFLHQYKARLMRLLPGAYRDRWVGRCEMAAWVLMLWMWRRRRSTTQVPLT